LRTRLRRLLELKPELRNEVYDFAQLLLENPDARIARKSESERELIRETILKELENLNGRQKKEEE